jgi:tRNA-dihydrouridine synthase B
MNSVSQTLHTLLAQTSPVLALAPMQDVTDLPFWGLMSRYGGPDVYYTEYFRVHSDSRLERDILRSLDENPTGKPAIAQMIGNDPGCLARNARELQQHPVIGIDLNLGCPAPIVYKKCAGGGLLRELDRVDRILGELRAAVHLSFSVKTRIGFQDEADFDALLALLVKHQVDLVTVHGRTVLQMYRPGVRYDLIAHAASSLTCPVLANGDISSAADAQRVLAQTGVRGLMLGRGAIRNPWLFDQIRAACAGMTAPLPTGTDVLHYLHDLYETVTQPGPELPQVHKMKRYVNYLGIALPDGESFLHAIRRSTTRAEFFAICTRHLDHTEPLPLVPLLEPDKSDRCT